MKLLATALLVTGVLCAQLQAQQPARQNTTGFGSVLYPGLGGPPPPAAHGGFGSVLFPGTEAPGNRVPVIRPGGTRVAPPPVAHPFHSRTAIVPVPVYYGGYYYGADGAAGAQPAPAYDALAGQDGSGQPVVVLNQGYLSGNGYGPADFYPPSPSQDFESQAQNQPPTIYLLAMQDHTIIPAIAYWVDPADTLNYITSEGSQNRISLSLIDRDFSKQLNDSRHVEFKLPPSN